MRQPPNPAEILLQIVVESGGGVYRGIQPCYGLGPDLVLFHGPTLKTTHSLPLLGLSTEAVRAAILKKEREWGV